MGPLDQVMDMIPGMGGGGGGNPFGWMTKLPI